MLEQRITRETLDARIRSEAELLAQQFKGIYSPETVSRNVWESMDRFKDARILDFLPLLMRRYSQDRLSVQYQLPEGAAVNELSVLYICTHNAGRSQMAALLTESLNKGRVRASSAGSAPSDAVNPVAVQAMKEIGIDMTEAVPKPLTDQMVVDADVVVTMGSMGCGDACPVITHKMYRDWSINDPAGQGIETVREVRDSVRSHVESLLLELGLMEPGA
jgi:arsenate reductase